MLLKYESWVVSDTRRCIMAPIFVIGCVLWLLHLTFVRSLLILMQMEDKLTKGLPFFGESMFPDSD